jgi:hypothetical protein
VFTRTKHWTQSWAKLIKSTRISYSRSILNSPHLYLGPPSDLFPLCIPTNILYKFLICRMRTTCLVCIPILDIKRIITKLQLSPTSCYGPNILRSTPFWNNLNPLKPKLVQITFKNSVRTAKKTQHFTITKINLFLLFKEIIAVDGENYMKPINILRGQNA